MELFEANSPLHLLGPYLCARDTGQRQGDILAMRWNQYNGSHIELSQGKTGVPVRVSQELKRFLDDQNRKSTHIFTNSRGRPWTSDGFQTSFGKFLRKDHINLAERQFHDLRGTFATMRRREGASLEEISLITGHSLKQVHSILEKHYLAFDQEVSDRVIIRLDKNRKGTKTVNR